MNRFVLALIALFAVFATVSPVPAFATPLDEPLHCDRPARAFIEITLPITVRSLSEAIDALRIELGVPHLARTSVGRSIRIRRMWNPTRSMRSIPPTMRI